MNIAVGLYLLLFACTFVVFIGGSIIESTKHRQNKVTAISGLLLLVMIALTVIIGLLMTSYALLTGGWR